MTPFSWASTLPTCTLGDTAVDISEDIMFLLRFVQVGNHAEQNAWDGFAEKEAAAALKP